MHTTYIFRLFTLISCTGRHVQTGDKCAIKLVRGKVSLSDQTVGVLSCVGALKNAIPSTGVRKQALSTPPRRM